MFPTSCHLFSFLHINLQFLSLIYLLRPCPLKTWEWQHLLSFYLVGKQLLKFERIWNTFEIKQLLNGQLRKVFRCPVGRRAGALSKQLLLQFVCQGHKNTILQTLNTVWFMGVNRFFFSAFVRLCMWLEQSKWSSEAMAYVFKFSGWSKVKPVIITLFSPDTIILFSQEGGRGAIEKTKPQTSSISRLEGYGGCSKEHSVGCRLDLYWSCLTKLVEVWKKSSTQISKTKHTVNNVKKKSHPVCLGLS